MKSKITLPVIKRLRVRGYSLYPGAAGAGLDLAFPSGVTVLAGINGVGKTTLLNLLMRMLLGPLDRPKGERELSRVSKRKLVEDKDFSFFRDRVPEGDSLDATAALEFSIGNHSVKLVRSLRTMKLTTVAIDREPFEPDDERYC